MMEVQRFLQVLVNQSQRVNMHWETNTVLPERIKNHLEMRTRVAPGKGWEGWEHPCFIVSNEEKLQF